MPVHEVFPDEDYQEGNPYIAVICEESSESFAHGIIRVEPPFTPGEDLFDYVHSDVGVNLVHMLSTKEATLLGFYIDEDAGFQTWANERRVMGGVRGMLGQLGRAASKQLFTREYTSAKGED